LAVFTALNVAHCDAGSGSHPPHQWRSHGSIIDAYARRIVGWRVSTSAHAGSVLDALEQAAHERRPAKGMGLVHHSDRGSQ